MKKLSIFLVALLCSMQVGARNLVVTPLSGREFERELFAIGKLVHRADSLYLYDAAGNTLYKEQRAKVHTIRYAERSAPTTIGEGVADISLRVYPNPATSVLVLEGTAEGVARLYNRQGQIVKTADVHGARTTLDVSNLPAGAYVLVCDAEAFTIIKE